MLQEHVEQLYLPAVREYRRRLAEEGANAEAMARWELRLRQAWPRLHIGEPTIVRDDSMWQFSVPVYRGDLAAEDIRVELYAEPRDSVTPVATEMQRSRPIAGSQNGDLYIGTAAATRPAADYTVRVGPAFLGVNVPAELPLIVWQK